MTASPQGANWDLNDLYRAPDDPAVLRDEATVKTEAARLRDTYRGTIASLIPAQCSECLQQIENINMTLGRLGAYAFLLFSVATGDEKRSAFMARINELTTTVTNDLLFFELEWAALDDATAHRFEQSQELHHYQAFLGRIRKYRQHLLSEAEEIVTAKLAITGAQSFNKLFEKIQAKMAYGAEGKSQEEVLSGLYSPDRAIRKASQEMFTAGLQGNLHILTHIYNAMATEKMVLDEMRHYPHWLRYRNLSNELEDDAVASLVSAITSRYDIVANYYTLKRQILGGETLYDYDRYAPISTTSPTYDWDYAVQAVCEAFASFSPRLAVIAQEFFNKNWVDSKVVPGKRSGAYAHPVTPDTHPYLFSNFTGRLRDIETLAHEMGHGVHQYLARKQGYFGSNTPLVLAETASVFAEMVLFKREYAKLSDPRQQLGILCGKLESMIATVFRQTAMNRFEHELHTARRAAGELSSEAISDLWHQTQQAMFGESVTLTDNYRIWWSYIPHFLNAPGYVYSYAFGELLVLALYGRYQQVGETFIDDYIALLECGGTLPPAIALRRIGIDIDDPAFWQQGLAAIEELVNEAWVLYKGLAE